MHRYRHAVPWLPRRADKLRNSTERFVRAYKLEFIFSCTFYEESIMGITCWMVLRLKESIKVPERAFNKVVGWHFCKPGSKYART